MRLLVVGTFAVRRPQAASLLELATKLVRDFGVVGGVESERWNGRMCGPPGQRRALPGGSDAPDEIDPAGVEAAGGGLAGTDDCPVEERFDDRCLSSEGEVGPLGA
ncbi:hypothetical protein BH10ACT2_BH10ACT2_28460 [soil metagenome]